MRNRFSTLIILAIVGVFLLSISGFQKIKHPENQIVATDSTLKGIDPETGLVIAPGFEFVRVHCVSCHSSKLVTQYRATRERWLERIRWMQKNHKLWDLGEIEPNILDYLAKYYPPTERNDRRPPLKDVKWYKLEE